MTDDHAPQRPRAFAFGPFVLVPERQLLLRDEASVRIGGRALDLLTVLVERPGELVSKRELISRTWPNTVVEEANLKVNVAALRRVLGDVSGDARYIATVTGRGYRFVAPVRATGAAAGAGRAASVPAHNLPVSTVRVVGRAEAIDAVVRELDASRLVSIVGAGGIGKTTVALAVAGQGAGSHRHGVWFVDLAPLNDPALVPNAVATAVGLAAHSANVLAALCEFLRGRDLLLVLDSCEHLIDGVAACVSRLLADAGSVKILATSREPLRVKGERVRRLPELGTPPLAGDLKAGEALAFPAVELFVERATERSASFRLDDANAPVVARICRRLDGLALAIELAATRVDAFDVAELSAQLDDRLGLLEGHRAGVERHRTLAATLDWSYALLPDAERTILRRLGTFAGGFSLASACAVAGDGAPRATLVEDIAGLVAKSLVATEPREAGMEYRLLDTTRSYALEKLAAGGEIAHARRRHAEHLLDLARRAGAEGDAVPREAWIARHASRIDDLRNALAWALPGMADVPLGIALTVAAIPFWERLSLLEECRVAVALALDDRFEAHRTDGQTQALYLALGASLLYTRGPLPAVKSALARALDLAERADDNDSRLECLRGLSEYELWTGNTRSALSASDRMRSIAAASGDDKAGENADAQAGSALRYLGDLAASQQHLERIVGRPSRYGERSDASRFEFDQRLAARGSLASVLWLRGFPDQAVAMAARQRDEAEASHHAVPLCSAVIHTTVGIALFVGDLDHADRLLAFIEHYATEHRLTVWRAMATCMRGRWLLDAGKPFALAAFRDAVAELYDHGLRMRYPSYLANLGEGLAQLGDVDGAHASLDKALALSQSSGQVWGMSEILRMKGNLLRSEGTRESRRRAAERYEESLRWAREQGALSWELRTAASLVALRRETGDDAAAVRILCRAYERFDEGFGTRDLQRARSLLDGESP